jgi:hypothetical protein
MSNTPSQRVNGARIPEQQLRESQPLIAITGDHSPGFDLASIIYASLDHDITSLLRRRVKQASKAYGMLGHFTDNEGRLLEEYHEFFLMLFMRLLPPEGGHTALLGFS